MNNYIIERKYFTMDDCNITKPSLKALCKSPNNEFIEEFLDLFVLKYKKRWIISGDKLVNPWELDHVEPTPDEDLISEWEDKFSYIERSTEDRYLEILKLYKEQKANLLNKINATSVTKYNDTPQTAQGVADPYTSSITTNEREVDPNELIDRLNKIERQYSDVIANWVEDFNKLFGTSVLYN